MRRPCEVLLVGAAVMVALALTASAQTAPGPGQPATTDATALAPVLCYEAAESSGDLPSIDAIRLCMGAANDAPARCFTEASARGTLSSLQAVTLCAMATSTEPADCARRLEETTNLPPVTVVEYCSASRWPAVASRDGGAPACLEAALDRTTLPQIDAVRLCAGSPSDAPVTCFAWGHGRLALTDADLITLCAPVVVDRPEP
ncbi:MAG TPA: hypothetical protein VFS15_18290 [Kofleriaceae bacterium]|nr:hypothetical protein [Kofleriaceae bacterium]